MATITLTEEELAELIEAAVTAALEEVATDLESRERIRQQHRRRNANLTEEEKERRRKYSKEYYRRQMADPERKKALRDREKAYVEANIERVRELRRESARRRRNDPIDGPEIRRKAAEAKRKKRAEQKLALAQQAPTC